MNEREGATPDEFSTAGAVATVYIVIALLLSPIGISAAVAAYLWLLNGAIAGGFGFVICSIVLLLIATLSFVRASRRLTASSTRILLRIAATVNILAVFVVALGAIIIAAARAS